jgi:hypothetical protein
MSRDVIVMVSLADGSLHDIAIVRPVLLGGDGKVLSVAATSGAYTITLELAPPDGEG